MILQICFRGAKIYIYVGRDTIPNISDFIDVLLLLIPNFSDY